MAHSLFRALAVSRAPLMALSATGVSWGCFSAMVPAIKAQTGASDALFGLALLGSAAGGMLAIFAAPRLFALLGHRVLPVLGVFSVLALQLPVVAQTSVMLFAVMIAMGMSIGSFDINANLRISALEGTSGLHLMNLNHGAFSLAFGLSAFVTGTLRAHGVAMEVIFPLMGLVVAGLSVLTWERGWDEMPDDPDEAPVTGGLPWRAIVLIAVMLFASFVGENAVDTWSSIFLERDLGVAAGHGAFGPAMLGLVMGCFRLLGYVTTQRFGEARVLMWSGFLAMTGVFLLSSAQGQGVALSGIGIAAAGLAVIVPTATSLLGKRVHRRQRNLALSRAWMVGFTGFFVGPSAMGFLAEHVGLRGAFLALALLLALVAPAVMQFERMSRTGRLVSKAP